MNFGARNQMVGEVVDIKKGNLMCQVKVKVPSDAIMCSVMTLESLDELALKEGDKVGVIVKAVNVLLTTEGS